MQGQILIEGVIFMKTQKSKLIGSSSSLPQLTEFIQKYFFWQEPPVLSNNSNNIWNVSFPNNSPKAGTKINFIIRKQKNRYRFEMIGG